MKLLIYTDGGARGNPGPAAIGVVVKDGSGKTIKKISKGIGSSTNNVAEYTAVIEALTWLKSNDSLSRLLTCSITLFLDSLLVVNQLNGIFKVKDSKLRELVVAVRQLENLFGVGVRYCHVPREKNKEADALVNQSLDAET